MEGEKMAQQFHAGIAYVACRLIMGKKIAALFDVASSREIPMSGLPDEASLRAFDEGLRDYVPGFASDCTYRYETGDGTAVEIFINERTFIVHARGSDSYFIGNIQRDMVYLYDHKASAHFRYRILAYVEDTEKTGKEYRADISGRRTD